MHYSTLLGYWVYCKRFGVISNNKYRSGNTLDLSSVILAESTWQSEKLRLFGMTPEEEEIQQLQTEIELKKNAIRAQFKKNERKGTIEIVIALLQLASVGALFAYFPCLQLGCFL